jgi:hypothetical protein
MVRDVQYCVDILSQISAAQAALDTVARGFASGTPKPGDRRRTTGSRTSAP